MAISFVGSSTGITSATLPAHQAGDVIVAFAYRDGSATSPTVPAGWTAYYYGLGSLCGCSMAVITATSSSTVSGTWTNATSVIFHVYRGVSFANNAAGTNGTITTVTFPAVAIYNAKSWVVGFVGSRSTNVAIESAPSGMVNRSSVSDAVDEVAGHDTNAQVSSFAKRSVAIGGTASGWVSAVLELADISQSATATVTGKQVLADNFIFPENSNWHPWYFGPRTVGYSGSANNQVTGIGASSSFASISAIGQTNVKTTVNGIQAVSGFASIASKGNASGITNGSTIYSSLASIAVKVSDSQIINGIQAVSLAGQLSVIGAARSTATGIPSSAAIQNVLANGGASWQASGIGSSSNSGIISSSGAANHQVNGLSYSLTFGDIGFSAFASAPLSGVEISSFNGSATVTISDSQIVNGIEAVSLAGQLSISGESNHLQSGVGSESNYAPVNASAEANLSINGISLFASTGETAQSGDSEQAINGVDSQSINGSVSASASQSIDATASVSGYYATSEFGSVNGSSENPEVWASSGQVKRYPANHIVNSVAKPVPVTAKVLISSIYASGSVEINAIASASNVVSFAQVESISADGILSISEDELIMLLAA